MATDYTANSKRGEEKPTEGEEPKKEKHLEVVVKEPVIIKKKSLGRRFLNLLVEADLKGAAMFVIVNRMIPYVKDMAVLSGEDYLRRIVYRGKDHLPRSSLPQSGMPGTGYRVQYNNPLSRSTYPPDPSRVQQPQQVARRVQRFAQDDLILSTKEDAESALRELKNVIEQFDVASIFDLHEIVGVPSSPQDMKWGWTNVHGTPIYQVSQGWLLALPPVEQL